MAALAGANMKLRYQNNVNMMAEYDYDSRMMAIKGQNLAI